MNELERKRSLTATFKLIVKDNIIEYLISVWLILIAIFLVISAITGNKHLLFNTVIFLIVLPFLLIILISFLQYIIESLKELYRRCEIISELPITEDEIKKLNIKNCTDYILFLMCYRTYLGKYNNFYITELPESLYHTIETEAKRVFKDSCNKKLFEYIDIYAYRDYIVKDYMTKFLSAHTPTDNCIELCQSILDSRGVTLSLRDILEDIKLDEKDYEEYLQGQAVL